MDGVEVDLHSLLSSALDVGEWSSTSSPDRFTPRKGTQDPLGKETRWGRKKYFAPFGIRAPDLPARNLVTMTTILSSHLNFCPLQLISVSLILVQ
jgi:hypothetical protein